MSLIGNIIWFIFGGLFMGIGWALAGVLCFITIIGIPWARACMTIAAFSLFPFGKTVVRRDELTGREDIGTGPLGFLGNVIWAVFLGVWLALGHLMSALFCFLTIIGIPFGVQHLKLAALSLAPIGAEIVPYEALTPPRIQ